MIAALAALLVGTPPAFVIDDQLGAPEAISEEAAAFWRRLEETFAAVTSADVPRSRRPIRVRRAANLRPTDSGRSEPGISWVRQNVSGVVDEAVVIALRHELAHQFLWVACPVGHGDALLHEAFAIATSGELTRWSDGPYLSVPKARKILEASAEVSLSSGRARRAIARLLANTAIAGSALPIPLERRLRLCASAVRWTDPIGVTELAEGTRAPIGSAAIAINRHSGLVVIEEGDVRTPMPYGSTLKPFVIAGHRGHGPRLRPRRSRPEWQCGARRPARMDEATALLRSCNGYFLDWARSEPIVARFGVYEDALVRLGLPRAPEDMAEAIGIRPTLALSPWSLAQAYRLLAEASPEVIETLRRNGAEGTLSGLPTSRRLATLATKTGTVRTADSRPKLGWIVGVDEDLVVVMAKKARAPRTFAGELSRFVARARKRAGQRAARVQVFGLLSPEQVQAACEGAAFRMTRDGPVALASTYDGLLARTGQGRAICLGGSWRVRFPGGPEAGRAYAGIFAHDPAPRYRPPRGAVVSRRARRARRGSDFVFVTSVDRYAAGVLAAEDARIEGPAREALARVVAHNAGVLRHRGRPVCDTTHCQVFLGTRAPGSGDAQALAAPPLRAAGWLMFSRGGDEPWIERRPVVRVEAILGRGAARLRPHAGKVDYVVSVRAGPALYDEARQVPCPRLSGPLKLPSCPDSASRQGAQFVFRGRGQGHGQGLDVEHAKRSDQTADEILRAAYGVDAVR